MEIEDSRIHTLRLLAISEPFSAAPLLFYAEDLLRYPALTTHIRPDQTEEGNSPFTQQSLFSIPSLLLICSTRKYKRRSKVGVVVVLSYA
jgi:hypothetical protein